MPAAALFVGFIAVETGVAAAIGTALASTVGLSIAASGVTASLAAGTISTAAAVAVGSGVVSAGISLAQGNSLSNALKGAVIGGVASFAGAGIASSVTSSISAAATDAGLGSIASSIGKVSGAMAGGATSSAIQAVVSGKDPIEALIKGGLTAGVSSGVSEGVNVVTSKIPGFDNLAKDYGGVGEAAQRAIKAGLTSGVLGKNVSDAVLNSVVGSVSRAGGDLVKDVTSDLKTAYNNATSTGNTLTENYFQQNQLVDEYKSTAAEAEAKRQEIQDNVDKYNKAKEELDALPTYARFSRVTKTAEVSHYATLANEAFPDFEKLKAEAENKVTKLDELKTAADPLEKTLTDQKAVLQTQVQDYLTQEEVNAQNVAKAVADAATAKERIEAATGTTLTQEQLDAIVKTGDVKTAADDFIKTNTPTNVVPPVNTTTTETPPTTVTQPTGAAAISTQEIMDYVATHSEEEIKAAMERTGVSQAQVDAAKAYITTGEAPPTVTAPVTSTVTTDNSATATNTGPSAEVIKNFVDTHTPEEVQAAMLQYGVSQAQVDAATKPVTTVAQVDAAPVVQPVVNPVVAPPPVVVPPVDEPVVAPVVAPPVVAPPVLPPVVNPPPIAPVVQPPVVSPPVLPPVVEPPVIAPVVQPPVVETPVVEQPVTAPLVLPPAETAADLQKVFPTVAEKSILPTGGLETIASNLQNPIAVPTTTNPVAETPGGLNAVSGNLVDTGSGLQMPDFSKTFGSMATKFLQSKLTPAKRPTTAPKPSSVPRLASTPVGGLSAVKAPVKAAAAPRVDVSKLIPVQKAVAAPKTPPSNAKLTPVRNIANLTSLVKKVG